MEERKLRKNRKGERNSGLEKGKEKGQNGKMENEKVDNVKENTERTNMKRQNGKGNMEKVRIL